MDHRQWACPALFLFLSAPIRVNLRLFLFLPPAPAACPCRLPLRITPAVCLYRPHSALLRVTTLLNRR